MKSKQKKSIQLLRVFVVQLLSCVRLFVTSWMQHARFPCPLPSSRACSNHIHWISDAIQPSCPLSSPSPVAGNLSQHQSLFQWVGSSHLVAKVGSFRFSISPSNEYSGLISFRIDLFDLLAVPGTLKSLLQHHRFRSISFLVFSLLYGTTLTSIPDYWKNHNFNYMDLYQQSNADITLSRYVIAFLPRSKRLLVSWLQSPSAVIFIHSTGIIFTIFVHWSCCLEQCLAQNKYTINTC